MNWPMPRMYLPPGCRRPSLSMLLHTHAFFTALAMLLLHVSAALHHATVGSFYYVFAEAAAALQTTEGDTVADADAAPAATQNTTQVFEAKRLVASPRTATYRKTPNLPASPTANASGEPVLEAGGSEKSPTTWANRAPARRLNITRAVLTAGAQYLFNSEARRSAKRLGYKLFEVVKGIPSVDVELDYLQHKDSCLTVFDFTSEGDGLGLVLADHIIVKYLPPQHRGVIEYGERRRTRVEFLKKKQRHKQIFLLPHGCVATPDSTWVPFCVNTKPPCYVGRVDIHTSAADPDEPPVPLQPVSNDEVNEKLVADGWDWYTVQDLYEGLPDYASPLTMKWDNDQCVMHAHFETKDLQKTQFFWMKSRQAFQILIEQLDGTLYRRMSRFPPMCGGRTEKDYTVTVKELEPANSYKAIMMTQVYGKSVASDSEEITLQMQDPQLPIDDWDSEEEEIEFTELFPETPVKRLAELEFGPFE